MASDSIEKKPNDPTQQPAAVKKSVTTRLSNRLSGMGILLLELLVPTALAIVLAYYLTTFVNLWSMERTTSLVFFGVIVTALSLGISIFYDSVVASNRLKRITNKKARMAEYRLRLVRLVVGGLLIPVGVVVAANLITLPGGGTPMDAFIQATTKKVKTSPATLIADAVLNSTSSATRLQGIKTLQVIHSTDALDQLLRMLKEGSLLKNASTSEALSQALASYGLDAKPRLLTVFSEAAPEKENAASSTGLYQRYLASPVDELSKVIAAQDITAPGAQTRTDQFTQAVAEMKAALAGIDAQQPAGSQSGSLQDFVLSTFLAMNLKQDNDLSSFARTTAANTVYSDEVRGKALLLIAQLGGKGDFDVLYKYLADERETVRAKAMEAIANLELKVNGSTK